MAREAHEVDVERVDVERQLPEHLRRVGVEERAARAAERADLGERLQRADLVVDGHDRDERRVGPRVERGRELGEVDEARLAADGQVRHVEALLLERAARVEHALVLGHGRDHVALPALEEPGHALDRHVVRFGGAGGEDYLAGIGVDHLRHLLARVLDRVTGFPAIGMRCRMRIAEGLGEIGGHRRHDARVDRRRRLVIKIDRARPLAHAAASALFAGHAGLDDYRVIIPQLGTLLLPGGVAVLEIGAMQYAAVSALARESGFAVTLRRDLAGRPRALVLR